MICEITSGGDNSMPKVNAKTNIQPLFFSKYFLFTTPNTTKPFTTIGTCEANPKAKNNIRLKSKNFVMSVEISTVVGLMAWKKLKTLGSTTKKQKQIPSTKRKAPIIDLEKINFFSSSYKPGAIKLKIW